MTGIQFYLEYRLVFNCHTDVVNLSVFKCMACIKKYIMLNYFMKMTIGNFNKMVDICGVTKILRTCKARVKQFH